MQPSKAKAKAVRFPEVDLNEDSEDEKMAEPSDVEEEEDSDAEESGEDDEFIDVLDVLDGRGDPMDEDDAQPPKRLALPAAEVASDSGGDEEDDDDEEDAAMDEDDLVASDEDVDADALDNLHSFVSSLPSAPTRKRKLEFGSSAAEPSQPARKRRVLKETGETGAENEYRPHTTGAFLVDTRKSSTLYLLQARNLLSTTSLHHWLPSLRLYKHSRIQPDHSSHPRFAH